MPGSHFDELSVGQVFRHSIRRTVTEADDVRFSGPTHDPTLVHLDEGYCRTQAEFGQRLVDALRIETEVVELRQSRSRPAAGIVTFLHRAFNQRGEFVAHREPSGLRLKRPAAS